MSLHSRGNPIGTVRTGQNKRRPEEEPSISYTMAWLALQIQGQRGATDLDMAGEMKKDMANSRYMLLRAVTSDNEAA